MKVTFPRIMIAAGIVWLALLWLFPSLSQSHLFYSGGCGAFWDYRIPRMCVASSDVYVPDVISRVDAPYPAFGYALAALFPRDVFTGGLIFTAFSLVVLAAGAWAVSRDRWLTLSVGFMSPVLHAVGVGNQILLAMGGVLLFQAWKDEHGWKRHLAFLFLAVATALKVLPCIFGLTLLKERRWRDFAELSVYCAVLLFVPFAWMGGVDGVAAFLQNLHLHSDFYAIRSRYGFVPIDRSVRLLLGMDIDSVRQTLTLSRALSVALGAACIWRWFKTSDRAVEWMMLAAATLFLPSVTQFYSLMYLLPAIMICRDYSRLAMALLFVALCPIQIPLMSGGVNMILSNLAIMGFVTLVIVKGTVGKASPAGQAN